MHTDKHNCIDCIVREQWCIEQAKKEWEENFIDFESAIDRIRKVIVHLLILTE